MFDNEAIFRKTKIANFAIMKLIMTNVIKIIYLLLRNVKTVG